MLRTSPRAIEFDNAEFFGVADVVAEYQATTSKIGDHTGEPTVIVEIITVEYVVSQNQGDRIVANEFFGQQKGLCDASGFVLDDIREGDAQFAAVPEESLEQRQVARG